MTFQPQHETRLLFSGFFDRRGIGEQFSAIHFSFCGMQHHAFIAHLFLVAHQQQIT